MEVYDARYPPMAFLAGRCTGSALQIVAEALLRQDANGHLAAASCLAFLGGPSNCGLAMNSAAYAKLGQQLGAAGATLSCFWLHTSAPVAPCVDPLPPRGAGGVAAGGTGDGASGDAVVLSVAPSSRSVAVDLAPNAFQATDLAECILASCGHGALYDVHDVQQRRALLLDVARYAFVNTSNDPSSVTAYKVCTHVCARKLTWFPCQDCFRWDRCACVRCASGVAHPPTPSLLATVALPAPSPSPAPRQQVQQGVTEACYHVHQAAG